MRWRESGGKTIDDTVMAGLPDEKHVKLGNPRDTTLMLLNIYICYIAETV